MTEPKNLDELLDQSRKRVKISYSSKIDEKRDNVDKIIKTAIEDAAECDKLSCKVNLSYDDLCAIHTERCSCKVSIIRKQIEIICDRIMEKYNVLCRGSSLLNEHVCIQCVWSDFAKQIRNYYFKPIHIHDSPMNLYYPFDHNNIKSTMVQNYSLDRNEVKFVCVIPGDIHKYHCDVVHKNIKSSEFYTGFDVKYEYIGNNVGSYIFTMKES